MSATINGTSPDVVNQLTQIETAAAKVLARLADRAAYAGSDEYQEIRSLMKALRGLLP